MEIFVDTADLAEIREASTLGVVSGVTTNPSLLAKNGLSGDLKSSILQIVEYFPNSPISVECVTETAAEMIAEGNRYAQWAENIYIKVPFGIEGMKAVRAFTDEGIKTNVTLVFSLNQVLLAALAGASFISSFVGRLDDIDSDGIQVIEEAVNLVSMHQFPSKILAASIRHPLHISQSALAGAHIATVPFKVLKQSYAHPLTTKGIELFKADWEALQKSAV